MPHRLVRGRSRGQTSKKSHYGTKVCTRQPGDDDDEPSPKSVSVQVLIGLGGLSVDSAPYLSVDNMTSTMKGVTILALVSAAECFMPSSSVPGLRATTPNAAIARMPRSAATSLCMQTVDDKTEVREYFNTEGFNRLVSLPLRNVWSLSFASWGLHLPDREVCPRQALDPSSTRATILTLNVASSRWNKIYSDSEDVNGVQKQIRSGHQKTIDKVRENINAMPGRAHVSERESVHGRCPSCMHAIL